MSASCKIWLILGDIINALPGNYYHYEPLLDFGIIQIRGPPYAESALTVLKSLLNCDYTDLRRQVSPVPH